MLKFVIGTAGTGKSAYITNQIISLAQQGEKCLLIVPEQFSKTGESILFSALEDARASLVSLYSFTSLMRDVQNNHRRLAGKVLDGAGKAVMARRAADRCKNRLQLYSRQTAHFPFAYSLAGLFDDFKRSGISARGLYRLVGSMPQKSPKLKELSRIYSEYCGIISDGFCDGEDLLLLLSQVLPDRYTRDTHIFVDGFESFSFGQLAVLKNMMGAGKDITFALTCDSLYDTSGGTGNFSFVQNTAAQLIKAAKDIGIKIAKPTVMSVPYRFKNEDLRQVDMFLQGADCKPADGGHVFATEFDSQYDEVAFTAARINTLVKNGYMYNDITVVCPQLEKYENQLQDSFTAAGIPYFIDAKRIISSSAPVMLFKSILEVMDRGLNAENIIPLLKTGLTGFDEETVNMLENYLYIWRDFDFDFNRPFRLPPGGIKRQMTPQEEEYLQTINGLRRSLREIFAPFPYSTPMGADKLLQTAYDTALRLKSDEAMEKMINGMPDKQDKELLVRQWDTVMECLDSLYEITGYDRLTPGEISRLFMLMIEGAAIGFAPQTQDCVMITDPKRMKLERVKAVFILGAAQDIFPSVVAESSLLSATDRQFLKENNYPLKNNFENLFSFENLYYYKALTSAGESLYISCCKKNIDTKQFFSSEIDGLRQALCLPRATAAPEEYAINPTFFAQYISRKADNTNRQAYMELLSGLGISSAAAPQKDFIIHDLALLEQVLGNYLTLSPTRVQSYYNCAFMYFLQRVLEIQPLEKAEFSPRTAGNYLHFIARKVMGQFGEEFGKTPWENILPCIDRAVEEYISSAYPARLTGRAKFAAQHENMKENAVQLLKYIHSEQSRALFHPIAFEEKIGLGSDIPPLKVTTSGGKTINIAGVCDRVDIYRGADKDYLRIVDYKTGTQQFSLDDVYNGLSSQLLLYMSALLKAGFGKAEKQLAPGAVIYQPADAAFNFDDESKGLYTPVGLALADRQISTAFDGVGRGTCGVIQGSDKIKPASKSKTVDRKVFEYILDYAVNSVKAMAEDVYSGKFECLPLEDASGYKPCRWCLFSSVCQNNDNTRQMKKNDFEKLGKEEK